MEQSKIMIASRETHLKNIIRANIQMLSQGYYDQFYQNICVALEKHFDTALLRWRRGESPVADMKKALATSVEMLEAITDWKLDDETLIGYGDVWNLVRYIAYLLDESATLPVDRLARIREDRSQYADVALDYHILDALEGREWRDGVAGSLERLAAKKRQMLAVETYRTYFDLIEINGNQEKAEILVRAAEANYNKRAKDGFYSGGPTYMGGGPDNPYVVDFTLAAILKYICWAGKSTHKWVWDGEITLTT